VPRSSRRALIPVCSLARCVLTLLAFPRLLSRNCFWCCDIRALLLCDAASAVRSRESGSTTSQCRAAGFLQIFAAAICPLWRHAQPAASEICHNYVPCADATGSRGGSRSSKNTSTRSRMLRIGRRDITSLRPRLCPLFASIHPSPHVTSRKCTGG